jgi:hypothetical protein
MKPFRWLRREPLRGGAFPDPAPAGLYCPAAFPSSSFCPLCCWGSDPLTENAARGSSHKSWSRSAAAAGQDNWPARTKEVKSNGNANRSGNRSRVHHRC